jgi:TPP-dependent pyruvate/acetoin dehydrogenase alpha subunit
VGVALAANMRREKTVVMNYIGDGGSNVGEFHEGLNMAAVMKLPFVLIIENNQFAYSTPVSKQYAAQRLSDRAAGYGIPGTTIDGTNVTKVYETCKEAVDRARRGDGPTLIETVTMRMHGHSASDDASYVPKGMIEEWKKKDPVEKFERILMNERVLSEASRKQMEQKISTGIEDAIQFALESPFPAGDEAGKGVFAP